MLWWKMVLKKRSRNSPVDNNQSYLWLDRWAARWNSVVVAFCGRLERRINRVSLLYQKVILICFFLSGVAVCVYIGFGGMGARRGALFKIDVIRHPAYVLPGRTGAGPVEHSDKPAGNAGFKELRKYLDSLSSTVEGKLLLDSLRKSRPGLYDSIIYTDRYFQLQ
jgi:hypothetical protein